MRHIRAKIATIIIELDHYYIYGVAIPSHQTFVWVEIFKVDKLKHSVMGVIQIIRDILSVNKVSHILSNSVHSSMPMRLRNCIFERKISHR